MTKHEQLVRQIAEDMAKVLKPGLWNALVCSYGGDPVGALRDPLNKRLRTKWSKAVKDTTPAARLTVERMAEEYKVAYSIGRDMANDPFSRAGLSTMLNTRGLIPSPEGFHCNNKGLHFSDPGYKDVCATQCDACKNYVS